MGGGASAISASSARDILTADFTVVGIGDMSGDVFGNGMLLSRAHQADRRVQPRPRLPRPRPRPGRPAIAERARLFALERSAWSDYDPALISDGGGVYARTRQVDRALAAGPRRARRSRTSALTPDELIRALLRAPVDLLWNGGIGTYVKAASETNADVGDRANDGVRVDGSRAALPRRRRGRQPRPHPARARSSTRSRGGRINTDAIDNVGGVNCSDREVNIKILLDAVVARRRADASRSATSCWSR